MERQSCFALFINGSITLAPGMLTAGLVDELMPRLSASYSLLGSGPDSYATDDPVHLAYHELNRQRGRLPGHTRIRIRDGARATGWFDYVFRSPGELAAVTEESPWTLSEITRSGPTYCARMELTS